MQCCVLSRDVAELVPWLRGQEASQRVIDHLTSLGLETRADLATYYIVPPPDAELAQLWRCARDEPFLDVAAAVEVSRAQMHNQAKTKTVATNHGRLTFRRPFCRGVSKTAAAQVPRSIQEVDLQKRPVAQALVDISWTWALEAGVASGLSTELAGVAARRKEICVTRLLRFDTSWLKGRRWKAGWSVEQQASGVESASRGR